MATKKTAKSKKTTKNNEKKYYVFENIGEDEYFLHVCTSLEEIKEHLENTAKQYNLRLPPKVTIKNKLITNKKEQKEGAMLCDILYGSDEIIVIEGKALSGGIFSRMEISLDISIKE